MNETIDRLTERRCYEKSIWLDIKLGLAYVWLPIWAILRYLAIPALVIYMFFAVLRVENKIDAQTETLTAIAEKENSTAEAIVFEWIRQQLEQLGETE